jgi:hypothetical protein
MSVHNKREDKAFELAAYLDIIKVASNFDLADASMY